MLTKTDIKDHIEKANMSNAALAKLSGNLQSPAPSQAQEEQKNEEKSAANVELGQEAQLGSVVDYAFALYYHDPGSPCR
jgi:hypothetical protein